MERCDKCGFVYDLARAGAAAEMIMTAAAKVAVILLSTRAETMINDRPQSNTWSPLEYVCHLRDVLLVQRERVLLARRVERPSCTPMGRDERADHDGYAEQDPADVARQLQDAAALFAGVLNRLGPDDWIRTLDYNYPEPTERSLRWVAVHTVHELRHHLADITRQLTVASN
jgi:hypothetical protein